MWDLKCKHIIADIDTELQSTCKARKTSLYISTYQKQDKMTEPLWFCEYLQFQGQLIAEQPWFNLLPINVGR